MNTGADSPRLEMNSDSEQTGIDPDEDSAAVELLHRLGVGLISAEDLLAMVPPGRDLLAELSRLRSANDVIAVRWRGRWCYPSFQFDENGKVLSRIAALLRDLQPELSHWLLLDWMMHKQPLLNGRRPFEAILDSDSQWTWFRTAAKERFDADVGLDRTESLPDIDDPRFPKSGGAFLRLRWMGKGARKALAHGPHIYGGGMRSFSLTVSAVLTRSGI
jgi:hypothetical protein